VQNIIVYLVCTSLSNCFDPELTLTQSQTPAQEF
jgi:hypothetical protein